MSTENIDAKIDAMQTESARLRKLVDALGNPAATAEAEWQAMSWQDRQTWASKDTYIGARSRAIRNKPH